MKTHELSRATGVKQAPKCAAESDKPIGNGKCMNTKKAMDSHGSEAHTHKAQAPPICT